MISSVLSLVPFLTFFVAVSADILIVLVDILYAFQSVGRASAASGVRTYVCM